LMSGFASAQNSKTIADIKTEIISSMEKDGYLSQKMAGEVSQKYITEADKTTVSKPMTMGASQVEQAQAKAKQSASWKDYLSWINFVKVLGVICLLIAFSGMIKKVIAGLWVFIAAVPMILYQAVFLGVGIVGIFRPDLISVSQQFYVALFFAFANLIVIGWIISTHKKIEEFIAKLFKLGIPPSCLASFYGMIYFAALAYFYQSSIFGFFAAVCLSGVFSFGLYYMPGVLYLNFKESMLPAVVFGHLAVLAIYTFMFKTHPEYTMFFDAGIQYYCTVALAVGLQFDASNFKSLALNGSLQSLKDGDFLASNHYIVKADITRSQKIINNNLGKTDLELVCEKKNAYMSIVGKNKDLFKSVIETTSTNNQLSFQLFSKPFVEFIEATLLVEEEAKIKVFTNEEIGLMEEILSVRGHNLELETAKKKCLRSINQRDVENYADVKSHSHTSLSFIGLLDREVINRFENQRKEKSREHVKFFKDANHTLEDCLEYLENNPLNSREYLKGYKNKVVEALKEKILSSANERLNYKSEQKEELLSGIKEITDNLNEGTDIIFTKEDMRLSASKFGSRKALAKLINGKEPRDGQRSENLSIIIGILSLANLCGAKLIMKSKMAKGYIDEKREVSELTEEDIKYFKEQEDKSRRVKA
jgi:hypothetical protein